MYQRSELEQGTFGVPSSGVYSLHLWSTTDGPLSSGSFPLLAVSVTTHSYPGLCPVPASGLSHLPHLNASSPCQDLSSWPRRSPVNPAQLFLRQATSQQPRLCHLCREGGRRELGSCGLHWVSPSLGMWAGPSHWDPAVGRWITIVDIQSILKYRYWRLSVSFKFQGQASFRSKIRSTSQLKWNKVFKITKCKLFGT